VVADLNPLLPAAALALSVLLAVRGYAMLTGAQPGDRFAPVPVVERRRREPPVSRLLDLIGRRVGPPLQALLGERRVDRVRRRLAAAGRPGGLTVERYLGRKAAFGVLATLAALALLFQGRPLLAGSLLFGGWIWMDVWLSGAVRRRQTEIERRLPDFLDVLAVTVGAGLGFRLALLRVAETLGGPLAEEILTTLRQMDLGAERRVAFEELRERNPSPSIGQFVGSLLQAEELGTPLSDALVELAADMRRSGAQYARRRAARAAPRVSLIVSLVLVPGTLVVLLVAMGIAALGDLGSVSDVFAP
jgi:tight adherence protein C